MFSYPELDEDESARLELERLRVLHAKKEAETRRLQRLEIVYLLSENIYSIKDRQRLAYMLFLAHRDDFKDESGNIILLPEDAYQKAYFFLAQALFLDSPDPPSSFILRFLARITSSRLATVRCFRTHPLAFLALNTNTGILFNALQLSYFMEIAVCLSILIEKSLRPKANPDEWWFQRIEADRLLLALSDREFLSIFTNALIWGVVNGVCYFDPGITPVSKALWNLGGFLADVVHDWAFAQLELNEYRDLKKAIENNEIEFEGMDLNNPLFQDALTNKIKILEFKKARLISAALLICAGMLLVFLPVLVPALLPHVPSVFLPFLMKITPEIAKKLKSIGSNIVIFGGVCIAGLGGRLFFSDLTWGKVGTYCYDIVTFRFFQWFDENTHKIFKKWVIKNFAINALVPLGTMGTLMLGAFLCSSPPLVLFTFCALMIGWFMYMKMNFSSSSPPPLTDATVPLLAQPLQLNTYTENDHMKLNFDRLFNLPETQLKSEIKNLRKVAGVNQNCFVKAMDDWSKGKPDSTQTIGRILDFYRVSSSASTVNPSSDGRHEATPSISPNTSISPSPSPLNSPTSDHASKPRPPMIAVGSSSDLQSNGGLLSWFRNWTATTPTNHMDNLRRLPSNVRG